MIACTKEHTQFHPRRWGGWSGTSPLRRWARCQRQEKRRKATCAHDPWLLAVVAGLLLAVVALLSGRRQVHPALAAASRVAAAEAELREMNAASTA